VIFAGGKSRLIEMEGDAAQGFDSFNLIGFGRDVFPASELVQPTGSVLERLTPRATLAHEAGHLITTRAGTAFEGGSLLDEFQASIVGRTLPGLNSVERYQLLRDAVERSYAAGKEASLV
jgi:hypothetical protein